MAPSTSPATNASQVVLGSQSHPSWATARVAPTIHGPGKAIRRLVGATLAVALAPSVNAYGDRPGVGPTSLGRFRTPKSGHHPVKLGSAWPSRLPHPANPP